MSTESPAPPENDAALIIEINAHPLMEALSEAMTAQIKIPCECGTNVCTGRCPAGLVSESLFRLRKQLRAHLEGLRVRSVSPDMQTRDARDSVSQLSVRWIITCLWSALLR